MRIILAWLLICSSVFAEQYTEFYVQTSGNNVNSGHTTNDAALYTTVNGNWDGTGVFTPTDGSTPATTVTNGGWASVYNDNATVAVYVAQVTNVAAGANGAIKLSQKALSGTAPTSSATGRSLKFGGAWAGPNTNQNPSVTFPWSFMSGNMTNGPTLMPCFNWKSAIYSFTNAVTQSTPNSMPMRISGYRTTPRDGVSFTNSGVSTVAGFTILTLSAVNATITDFAFVSNGASGSTLGVSVSGSGNTLRRFYVGGMRGTGMQITGNTLAEEFEESNCNLGAGSSTGGMRISSSGVILRNGYLHDNVASSNRGHGIVQAGGTVQNCILSGNSGTGILVQAPGINMYQYIDHCSMYNNSTAGIDFNNLSTSQGVIIDVLNCQFFKTTTGISSLSGVELAGRIANCTFGSGTMANTSGDIDSSITNGVALSGIVSYAANLTPWVDPDNGNFTVSSTSSDRARGTSAFYQAINSPTNTMSYPDVGATQFPSTNSGFATGFAQ